MIAACRGTSCIRNIVLVVKVGRRNRVQPEPNRSSNPECQSDLIASYMRLLIARVGGL